MFDHLVIRGTDQAEDCRQQDQTMVQSKYADHEKNLEELKFFIEFIGICFSNIDSTIFFVYGWNNYDDSLHHTKMDSSIIVPIQ